MADADVLQSTTFLNKASGEQERSSQLLDSSVQNKNPDESHETKLYTKRWVILVLYFLLSASGSLHWMQYTIIVNITSRYYGVSIFAVQWTNLSVNLLFFVGVFPAVYFIHTRGLRNACLLLATLSCIGTWIKYFAVDPDRFIFAIIAQVVTAPCLIFSNQLSATMTSHWFGMNEVSTVLSIACFGTSAGIGVTNLFTPIFIQNHESLHEIGQSMSRYFLGLAISTTVLAAAIFLWFENKPKLPPSRARLMQMRLRQNPKCLPTLKRLLRNKNYVLLWNAHGLGVGYVNTTALLIPLFVSKIENAHLVGAYAITKTMFGILGMAFFGRVLDRTKKFREIIIILYTLLAVTQVVLAGLQFANNRWLFYIGWANIGFFGLSYLSASLDTAVEITYPESEAFSTVLLSMSNKFFATIIGIVATKLWDYKFDVMAHVFLECVLICGFILTLLTKYEYRRQDGNKERYDVTCEIKNDITYKFEYL